MGPQSFIAHYRVTSKLGAGGMGEVWRATDTKLNRDVAIKILPDVFAQDAERMARFTREAKVLASLNHPNIAAIYGVEERALVMELVEGERLKGPLSLKTALDYARQIADALEAAHEKGIVHRDLKPGNIMVTAAGMVKVLDFGLAKVADSPAGDSENSPTMTISPTRVGVILGTAKYMAPEQARGKTVDRRADIWAFGCVLYEMLTGRPAFDADTTTDIIAAVVTKEPDLSTVPIDARRLIASCLQKAPKQRLQAIGDWRLLVNEGEAPATPAKSRISWVAAGLLAVATASLAVGLWRATRPVDHPLMRLSVDLGPTAVAGLNNTVAISPDGRRLVFPARGPDGKQQLATRLLDQAQSTLLPRTEDGMDPFFSPDGEWIGFYARGVLKKISVLGGVPVSLGSSINTIGAGASWVGDGSIIASEGGALPLSRIPPSGRDSEALTKLGPGELTHRWPQVLPDGRAVLFTASPSSSAMENASIEVVSLKTGQVKIIQRGGYYGRYLPSGHLVYVHQGALFGVKFDPDRLEMHGSPVPVVEDVAANAVTGGGQFDFSSTGTFVYAVGKTAAQAWQFAWMDTTGKTQQLPAPPGTYAMPRVSPDGRKLLFLLNGVDVAVYQIESDTTTRLTSTHQSAAPVWAPDSRHIVFESGMSFFWMRGDGAGEPQRLLASSNSPRPWSMSPDGRRLAYFQINTDTGCDIWTLPLDLSDPDHPKAGKPEPFLCAPAGGTQPMFSPDGRWIAYRDDESGSNEIYVRPFPAASGGKWQISSGGGLYAVWSKNGHQLYYEAADNRIMVVDYTVDGTVFVPRKPRLWSDKQIFYTGTSNLDLAPDGKRFVVLQLPEPVPGEKGSVHVALLLNFFDELRRRIP
jgi:Tol biopolymer transport system component/predicted Ser/Thr protein kinase